MVRKGKKRLDLGAEPLQILAEETGSAYPAERRHDLTLQLSGIAPAIAGKEQIHRARRRMEKRRGLVVATEGRLQLGGLSDAIAVGYQKGGGSPGGV